MADFFEIYMIDNRRAVPLQAYARLLNYSPGYLIELIKKLKRKRIYIGVKWRKYWYVFLPDINRVNAVNPPPVLTELPSGQVIDVDANWKEVLAIHPNIVPIDNKSENKERIPPPILTVNRNGKLGLLVSSQSLYTFSALTPKRETQIAGVQNATYRATTEYSYGNFIFYDPNKMSTFNNGTAGTLNSSQIPQAFFEVCRALDAAENTRNGANPGLPARRNLSTTVSFDTGTIAVAATIPIATSIEAGGTIKVTASDYLGSTYTTFSGGGGDLTSTNLVGAFLEIGSLLASAEKSVTPTENQPNNIQIQIDTEANSAVVSANIPFTTAAGSDGSVTIVAIDYL